MYNIKLSNFSGLQISCFLTPVEVTESKVTKFFSQKLKHHEDLLEPHPNNFLSSSSKKLQKVWSESDQKNKTTAPRFQKNTEHVSGEFKLSSLRLKGLFFVDVGGLFGNWNPFL